MGKLQDFLMEAQIGTTQTEVQIAPFPYPFIVKSITEAENKAILSEGRVRQEDPPEADRHRHRPLQRPPGGRLLRRTQLQGRRTSREIRRSRSRRPDQPDPEPRPVHRSSSGRPGDQRLHRRRERSEGRSKKLITGGGNEADADGESVYAHYALHRLKILPGALLALPRRERAFIYASIDLQIEKEKKEAAKAKRRKGKKGR